MSHKMNKYIVDTARDTDFNRTVLYAMRHHIHNYGNGNLLGHSCMTKVGNFPSKPACLALGDCEIIPVSLYLTKIVNTALITIHYDDIVGDNPQF